MSDKFDYAARHAVVGLIMVLIYCVIYVIIAAVKWVFELIS